MKTLNDLIMLENSQRQTRKTLIDEEEEEESEKFLFLKEKVVLAYYKAMDSGVLIGEKISNLENNYWIRFYRKILNDNIEFVLQFITAGLTGVLWGTGRSYFYWKDASPSIKQVETVVVNSLQDWRRSQIRMCGFRSSMGAMMFTLGVHLNDEVIPNKVWIESDEAQAGFLSVFISSGLFFTNVLFRLGAEKKVFWIFPVLYSLSLSLDHDSITISFGNDDGEGTGEV